MTIKELRDNANLTLFLEGRLDSSTFKELNDVLNKDLSGVECLVIDLEKLEYVSSAGLRVLLISNKSMSKRGKMIIRNANEAVMEVFQLTGFHKILTIE